MEAAAKLVPEGLECSCRSTEVAVTGRWFQSLIVRGKKELYQT